MVVTSLLYKTLRSYDDLPPEGGIYIIFSEDRKPLKIVRCLSRMDAGHYRNRYLWVITKRLTFNGGFVPIFEIFGGGEDLLIKDFEVFFEKIKQKYHEDLDFFLWNPELISSFCAARL